MSGKLSRFFPLRARRPREQFLGLTGSQRAPRDKIFFLWCCASLTEPQKGGATVLPTEQATTATTRHPSAFHCTAFLGTRQGQATRKNFCQGYLLVCRRYHSQSDPASTVCTHYKRGTQLARGTPLEPRPARQSNHLKRKRRRQVRAIPRAPLGHAPPCAPLGLGHVLRTCCTEPPPFPHHITRADAESPCTSIKRRRSRRGFFITLDFLPVWRYNIPWR